MAQNVDELKTLQLENNILKLELDYCHRRIAQMDEIILYLETHLKNNSGLSSQSPIARSTPILETENKAAKLLSASLSPIAIALKSTSIHQTFDGTFTRKGK